MPTEALWNGVELLYEAGSFRLGTDSVLCAGFADFPKGARVADLGCGGGAIGLMLLANDPSLRLTGIELDANAANLAKKNAVHNHLELSILHGDLREIRTLLPAGSMDGCISNPPYFPVGSGLTGALSQARSEEFCSLAQLCRAAGWLLKTGGRFVLVHRPERLADLIWELRCCHLEPKRIRFVRHRAEKPVSLVLMEARKGGKPGLVYSPDLVLHDALGQETEEYLEFYHRQQTLVPPPQGAVSPQD